MTRRVAMRADRVFLRRDRARTVPPMSSILIPRPDHRPRRAQRFAALDSSEPLHGDVLLGRVDGELRAALSLADGRVVADPFATPPRSSAPCARGRPDPQPRRGRVAARPRRAARRPARRLHGADPGEVTAPGRNELTMPDEAFLLGMPGRLRDGAMTVKIVTVFESTWTATAQPPGDDPVPTPRPARVRRSSTDLHHGDADQRPAAVACDMLARDARMLTIIGAGVQGEHHLRAFPLVRDFEEIRSARSTPPTRSGSPRCILEPRPSTMPRPPCAAPTSWPWPRTRRSR